MSTRSQVLKKLKRRQVRAKKLAEQSVVLGKVVGKELLVLGKGAALAVEPRFLRRARRRQSHLRRIKGVQWTPGEVEERVDAIERGEYLPKKAEDEVPEEEALAKKQTAEEAEQEKHATKPKCRDLSPRSRRAAKVDADAFALGAAPPTPRVEELRRRAAFSDLLQVVGRVNNYRQRLSELQAQRVDLDREREQLNDVLHFLHREIFSYEVHLKRIENDLSGASRVLTVRRLAQQQHDNASEVLKQATIDKKEKDIKLVGLEDDAKEAEDVARDLGVAVRDLLRQRVRQERQLAAVDERAAQCRGRADGVAVQLNQAQDL